MQRLSAACCRWGSMSVGRCGQCLMVGSALLADCSACCFVVSLPLPQLAVFCVLRSPSHALAPAPSPPPLAMLSSPAAGGHPALPLLLEAAHHAGAAGGAPRCG